MHINLMESSVIIIIQNSDSLFSAHYDICKKHLDEYSRYNGKSMKERVGCVCPAVISGGVL